MKCPSFTITLLAFGMMVASSARAGQAPPLPMTLQEAIERALAKNDGILIEREALHQARCAVSGRSVVSSRNWSICESQ